MMGRGKCVILVNLDLSAAFDKAIHELLVKDLWNIGVVNNKMKYFELFTKLKLLCANWKLFCFIQSSDKRSSTRNYADAYFIL